MRLGRNTHNTNINNDQYTFDNNDNGKNPLIIIMNIHLIDKGAQKEKNECVIY